jgi:hypothetical protein
MDVSRRITAGHAMHQPTGPLVGGRQNAQSRHRRLCNVVLTVTMTMAGGWVRSRLGRLGLEMGYDIHDNDY